MISGHDSTRTVRWATVALPIAQPEHAAMYVMFKASSVRATTQHAQLWRSAYKQASVILARACHLNRIWTAHRRHLLDLQRLESCFAFDSFNSATAVCFDHRRSLTWSLFVQTATKVKTYRKPLYVTSRGCNDLTSNSWRRPGCL
jgi:hypothetical protein